MDRRYGWFGKVVVTVAVIVMTVGVFCFFGGSAWSAPLISAAGGAISNGETITISGSGFGSKPSAAPFLWDTVDNIAAYNSLSNGQTVPVGSGYPWVANRQLVISLNEGRGGSKSYKAINTIKGGLDGRALTPANPSHLYVSWWWKPSADPNLPKGGHSSKFLRTSNSTDPVNKTFSWTQMQSLVYDNPNTIAVVWADYPGIVNGWNFHEVWFDNIARTYSIKVNGTRLVHNKSWAGGSGFYMNLLWGIGWDGGGGNPPALTTWMDDIYYDNTIARVMLGNAPTFDGSRHFEMQIPSSWTTSSITARFNQGAFPDGATTYLYVVDSNGAVNANGFAVKIGEGGAPAPAPEAPVNLRAE